MSTKLFDDFNQVSSKQWKQKIQFDLKGADYNEALIWHTNEDIAVKPFYHADDFSKYPEATHEETKGWKICQAIFVTDVKKANLKATNTIERGAESIKFIIPDETLSISDLIQNIDPKLTPINLELQFIPLHPKPLLDYFVAIRRKSGIVARHFTIGMCTKCLANSSCVVLPSETFSSR